MKRLGREDIGVRIPGNDGYLGTLNVYHEIHCLVRSLFSTRLAVNKLTLDQKRIHQHMYQEYYWKDLDDKQRELNRLHNGIRISIIA